MSLLAFARLCRMQRRGACCNRDINRDAGNNHGKHYGSDGGNSL